MKTDTIDPRRKKTREALVIAGLSLFGQRSPGAVTVDEIVREAGVGKGSFYNHFTDREGLVGAIAGRIRLDVEQRVVAANARITDPAMRMARANCCYYRFALEEREMAMFAFRETWEVIDAGNELDDGLRSDIALGKTGGRFDLKDVETGVVFVQGIVRQAVLGLLTEKQSAQRGSKLVEVTAMLLHGLGVERAESDALARDAIAEIVEPALGKIGQV